MAPTPTPARALVRLLVLLALLAPGLLALDALDAEGASHHLPVPKRRHNHDSQVLNGMEEISEEKEFSFVFRTDEEMKAFAQGIPMNVESTETAMVQPAPVTLAATSPTRRPTKRPTKQPSTTKPSAIPTLQPTRRPTRRPTSTTKPSAAPTITSTRRPTRRPTSTTKPSAVPTITPTRRPTPTVKPSAVPTITPTRRPTVQPSATSTVKPSLRPTARPSIAPTVQQSEKPIVRPSEGPTRIPTWAPTKLPSVSPTRETGVPTQSPSRVPSVPPVADTKSPTVAPTVIAITSPGPTFAPSNIDVQFPVASFSREFAVFNGSQNYYYATLPSPPLDARLTISLWLNTSKTASAVIVSYSRTASNFEGELLFSLNSQGKLDYWEYRGGYGLQFSGSTKVSTGARVHVVLVKNATAGRVYVNGVLDGSGSTTRTVTPKNTGFNLGNDPRDSNKYFTGSMDHINLYNYALSASEVQALYSNFIVPPTPAPTVAPSAAPTAPTVRPTFQPTAVPTIMPPTVAVVVSGQNLSPSLGFQVVDALKEGDSRNVTASLLRQAFRAVSSTLTTVRSNMLSDIFTNSTTQKPYSSISWSLGHDSVYFSIADSANTYPLFVSNYNYGGGSDPSRVVAVAGFREATGRFSAYGVNPFVTPFSYSNDILKRAVTWMSMGADPTASGTDFNITIAHLPNSYYFMHDAPTHNWFKAAYPQARINAINACDNDKLDACLASAKLLVIGCQLDRIDDTATAATTTNVPQVTAAVQRFLENGGAVLYVHYYRYGNNLADSLFSLMGLTPNSQTYPTNYWQKAGLKDADPFAAVASSLTTVAAAMDTLEGVTSLDAADICTSGPWTSCSNAAFKTKILDGVTNIRSTLSNFDYQGRELFATTLNQNVMEKIYVLLGDKYRTATGTTDDPYTVVQYPWSTTNRPALARMMFADSTVLYRRKVAPAQDDLGTLYCSLENTLLGANGCADYKNFATKVPRYNHWEVQDAGVYTSSNVWTTTGVFALPGVPFTVKRADTRSDVTLYIATWYQRDGTTKSLDAAEGTYTQYARPQFPRSTYVLLANNSEITITAPYGGPVYLGIVQNSGVSRTSDAPVKCIFGNVGRHPAILDVGNSSELAAFPNNIRSNPIPVVDIKAPGMELHMRADFFLSSLRNVDYLQNYSGPTGVETMLYDLRYNFLEAQMTLAGFKAPGKTLSESLPASVQTACSALQWNCTDESVHIFPGIQHANYDDRSACGNGCSGNPFDMDWSITPMGWGEAHELGHNMQIGKLQISWLATGKNRNVWSDYANRATENSNNIFPYHNKWRFYRKAKGYTGVIPSGSSWNGLIKDFVALQSAYAQINATVSGTMQTVVLDSSCAVQYSFPLGTPVARVAQDAVYANGAYAADNDARMAFYIQLPFIMTGKTVANDAITLTNGFEIFTLLYEGARTLDFNAKTDALWKKNRALLGFSLFNRTCAASDPCNAQYGGNSVTSMTGNDYILVMLTYLTGYDWRPHYDVRGLFYSSLAEQQVLAHIASGRANKGPIPPTYYGASDYPPADIIGAPVVALPIDGVTAWPFTNWSPAGCKV